MFCNNCGSRMEDGSLFCNNCGARVAPEAPVMPDYDATVGVGFAPQPQYQPPVQPQPDYDATVGVAYAPRPAAPQYQQPVQQPVYQQPVQPQPQYQQPVYQQPQWSYPPQQPQYQQPPVVPNMTYERAMGAEQPQPWSYVAEQPVKEKKPINKRKLFATIAACVLVLALVGGALAYFTIFNTPEYKVYTAARNTVEELESVLGKGKPIVSAVKNLVEMSENGEMSVNFNIDGQGIAFDYSRDEEILRAEANIMGADFVIAADDEKLALSLPGVLDNAYSVPLKDFGEKLCDWDLIASQIPSDVRSQLEGLSIDLFADTSWDSFTDTDAYDRFKEKLFFEEVEEIIPNADCETVYRIEADAEDLVSLYLAYVQFSLEPIFGEELASMLYATSFSMMEQELSEEVEGYSIVLLVGINEDDCIVAVHATLMENGEYGDSIAIVLAGENNPWEVIEAYENDRLVGSIRFVTTDSGFDLYADDYLVLRGDAASLTFDPNGYEPVTIGYSAENDGCGFSFDADGMPIEITMEPDVEAKMISGKVVDIFSLDMYDLEELAEEFEDLAYLFG